MKRNFIAIAALIAGVIAGALLTVQIMDRPATATTIAATYDMPHVKRPNILVTDLDRSLKIYRDILGFSFDSISESSLDSFSYPVFNIPREARMRYTYLNEPSEKRVFGITEVKGVKLPKPASAPYMTTAVIGITELESKFAKLKAMGLTVTESKTTGGTEFRFIEQAFVDFDGHLIVCYEILPD